MTEILQNLPLNLLSSVSAYLGLAATIVFLQSFYDPEIRWNNRKALIIGIFMIFDFVLGLFFYDNLLILFLYFVAYSIIPVYDCNRKFVKALKILLTQFVFFICSTNAIMVALAYTMPDYNPESLEITAMESYTTDIVNIIFLGCVFLYLNRRIAGRGLFIPATKKEHRLIMVYFLYSFILFVSGCISVEARKQVFPQPLQIIMAVSMVILSAVLPVFIYRNRISEYYRATTEYQRVYLEAELKHFQQYKYAQEETKRFRHDIKNNLLCLYEMLGNDKCEEAKEYLCNLLGDVQSLSQKYVSGDEMLDSIIASKAFVMEQKGIGFILDGVLAGGLGLEPIDICSIFANALDNAIEATEKLEISKKQITMKLKATDRLWFVTIENTLDNDVDVSLIFSKNGYTSKTDRENHGIGTYNMKRTVEKYGGFINADCKNNMFKLEIMLSRN